MGFLLMNNPVRGKKIATQITIILPILENIHQFPHHQLPEPLNVLKIIKPSSKTFPLLLIKKPVQLTGRVF